MKRIIIIVLLFSVLKAYPQANFSRLALGASGGITSALTGLSYGESPIIPGYNPSKGLTTNQDRVFGGSADYYFTPFIYAGLEFNKVTLRDGTDKYNRAFISNFNSIELRGSVALGQFVDFSSIPILYILRNINTSIGVGYISGNNNVSDFGSEAFPSRQHANDLGKSTFKNVISVPISLGYNINIRNAYQEPKIVFGVNYKLAYTLSDDLDGYNDDPSYFSNKLNDFYTTFGVSLKYLFGPKGLYYR